MFINIKGSREGRVFPSVYCFTLQTKVKCIARARYSWREEKIASLCGETSCSSMRSWHTSECYCVDSMLVYILFCMYIHITDCLRCQRWKCQWFLFICHVISLVVVDISQGKRLKVNFILQQRSMHCIKFLTTRSLKTGFLTGLRVH